MRITRPFGFTLLELMIVVAVIAVLAIIALPMYTEHVRKGKRSEAMQALGDLQLRQERYRADNPSYANALGLLGVNTTTYNSAMRYYNISILAGTATTYNLQATRKGDLANDPRCANFRMSLASGVVTKGMSDNNNVAYCWRQ